MSSAGALLRERLLALDPAEIGIDCAGSREMVWAALFELAIGDETATVVAVADGSVSLYTTSGFGVIGAGEHEDVRLQGRRFLDRVQEVVAMLSAADELPLPRPGEVRFHALTCSGRRTAAAPDELLASGRHELAPLFFAGHELVSTVRQRTDRVERDRGW